jgi:hypothetical protein
MNPDYALGYLMGAYKGDGHFVYRPDGKLKTATIRVCDKRFIDAVVLALRCHGYEPKIRLDVVKRTQKDQYQINWIPTALAVQLLSLPEGREQRRGFVAGFYDAEGSFSNGSLTMGQRKKAPLELVGAILEEFDFTYSLNEHGKNSLSRWCLRLSAFNATVIQLFFEEFEINRR